MVVRKFIVSLITIMAVALIPAASQSVSYSGTYSTADGKALEHYPTLDILNSFTGVVPGVYQTEKYGRTGVRFNQLNGALRVRSFENPVFIVDGVVVRNESELQITPEGIDTVYVIADILDKLKYGPEVAQGAIYIKTSRGRRESRTISFDINSGVDVVDRFPEWIGNGLEYACMNNMARINSMYPVKFTDFALERLAANDPMDVAFPSVDYRSRMFKNIREYNKASFKISGGSKVVTYSADIGYAGQGDIYKIGSESNYNRFNARMNMDIRVNDRLRVDFNFLGSYGIRKSPLGLYSNTVNASEFASVLQRALTTPATAYPLNLGTEVTSGKTIYPVSTAFPDHPYASLINSGYYKESTRTALTDLNIHYDLSFITPGLRSESMLGYKILYLVRNGKRTDYIGYNVDSDAWSSTSSTHKGQSDSDESKFSSQYIEGLQFRQRFAYDRVFAGKHAVGANLTYFLSKEVSSVYSGYHNQQFVSIDGKYCYDNRYGLDFIVNCAGSTSLAPGHRYAVFPAFGINWNISNESWMRETKKWVDFLRVHVQAGCSGNEQYGDQFYWQSRYTKSAEMNFGAYIDRQWFGSNTYSTKATTYQRIGNENLGWERIHELDAGLDARLFNHLDLGFSYYNTIRTGIVTDLSAIIPMVSGVTAVYGNYDSIRNTGIELRLGVDGTAGDFWYRVGASMLFPRSKVLRMCESVPNENLSSVGKSATAIMAYDCMGMFMSEAEIASSPAQMFDSEVYVGDLKYRDVTGDGVVDTNDRIVIGDTTPRMIYSLNFSMGYKGFDLNLVFTGKAGVDMLMNNAYYWNGWGDNNYSAFVRDNYKSGHYPRLSYVQSQNNFRNSQFWLADGSYFKLQSVDVGYFIEKAKMRIFLKGANLFTISAIKDCDPESLSAGVTDYPLFRTFTAGIKVTF